MADISMCYTYCPDRIHCKRSRSSGTSISAYWQRVVVPKVTGKAQCEYWLPVRHGANKRFST
jgi:hypothetical protein